MVDECIQLHGGMGYMSVSMCVHTYICLFVCIDNVLMYVCLFVWMGGCVYVLYVSVAGGAPQGGGRGGGRPPPT